MIIWVLAHGRDEDREVEEPHTREEIVILKTEQTNTVHSSGEGDGFSNTYITFAKVEPMFDPDDLDMVAMALYYKRAEQSDQKVPAWMFAPHAIRKLYRDMAGAALGNLEQHLKEKRVTREET